MIKIVIFIQIQYEHILIDCPPSLGLLIINALMGVGYVLASLLETIEFV